MAVPDETSQGRTIIESMIGFHAIMMDTPRFHLPPRQRPMSGRDGTLNPGKVLDSSPWISPLSHQGLVLGVWHPASGLRYGNLPGSGGVSSTWSLLHSLVADIITKKSQSVPGPGLMAVLLLGRAYRSSDVIQILSTLLHLVSLRSLVVVLVEHLFADVRSITDRGLRHVAVQVVRDRSTSKRVRTNA